MASPQKENGYTAIANELLEAFCRYSFPPKASVPPRLVLFVIRKTYGYHRKEDVISISQFQKAINEKNRSNVVYWLNYLVQAQILVKNKVSNMQVKYGLNKDYEQWLPLVQVKKLVQVRHWSSASNDTETSASNDTHKRKKETIQKKLASQSDAGGLGNEVINLFKEINPSWQELYKRKSQHSAAERLVVKHGFERLKKVAQFILARRTDRFCPNIATPVQLEDKWAALEKYALGLKASEEITTKPTWKIWN